MTSGSHQSEAIPTGTSVPHSASLSTWDCIERASSSSALLHLPEITHAPPVAGHHFSDHPQRTIHYPYVNAGFRGEITYSYGTYTGPDLPANAGTYTIKAKIDAEGNYAPAESTNTLAPTINKATATPVPGTLEVQNNRKQNYTYTLSQLLPALDSGKTLGDVTYTLGTVNFTVANYYDSSNPVTVADGKLTLPIKAVDTEALADIGTIKAGVSGDTASILPAAVSDTNRFVQLQQPGVALHIEKDGLSLHGTLPYGPFTVLRSDIIGPFLSWPVSLDSVCLEWVGARQFDARDCNDPPTCWWLHRLHLRHWYRDTENLRSVSQMCLPAQNRGHGKYL